MLIGNKCCLLKTSADMFIQRCAVPVKTTFALKTKQAEIEQI